MPNHRITLEFEATVGNVNTAGSRAGWSETWYKNLDQTDDEAQTSGLQYASARRSLLTPGWSMTAIRVSRLDTNANLLRKGRLIFIRPGDGRGTYNPDLAGGVDEQPYDAIEISVNSAGGHHRAFSMRGIGNDVINAGGRFKNPPSWNSRFPAYQGFLTNVPALGTATQGWALRIRSPIIPLGAFDPHWQVTQVNTGGTPGLNSSPQEPAITVGPAGTLSAGASVNITGAQGVRGLNGTWVVNFSAAIGGDQWYVLKQKRRTTVTGAYTQMSAQLTAWTYLLDNVAAISAGYGTSRRTGRPLQLVRGRRSNRPS